ncbi:MAG: glycosyltransferase family 9 protein, partial [Nitrospinota bacterium]
EYPFRSRSKRVAAALFDRVGYFLTRGGLRAKPPEPKSVRKILVVRLDHIGDVLYSLPLLPALKALYPGAGVSFLVGPWAKDLLLHNPHLHEVLVWDCPWMRRDGRKGMGGTLGFMRGLRRHRFDVALELRGDLRNILLLSLAGVSFRAGYAITGGGFLLNLELPHQTGIHQVERNLEVVRALGAQGPFEEPKLYLSQEERKEAAALLKELGVGEGELLVGVHPGAGYPTKRWGGDRFSLLIRRLINELSARVILFGSTAEKALAEKILDGAGEGGLPSRPLNLVGRTSLRQFMALAERLDLFIGNDSGPGHLAASLGTTFIGIFSGTNRVEEWGPRGSGAVVVRAEVDCAPCELTSCADLTCLERVTVEQVLEVARACVSA